MTRLYRSEDDRILGGVCGGIAEVYGFDPTIVRLVAVLLIFSGISPLVYPILWLVMPTESQVKNENNVGEDETGSQETESFECEECNRSFDTQRGLSVHQTQKH